MFFLLRMAFWLGVVCLLVPSGGPRGSAPDARINAKEAVTLASAAVTDMRGFCGRQPNACIAGGKVANALGHKAEAGARTLYRLIAAQFDKPPAGKTKVDAVAPQQRGTLTASDMQPAWHAPVPLPPRRPAA